MSNEVTVQESKEIKVFDVKQLTEKAAKELNGIKLEFPQLKIPVGGATYFDIDDESVKEIQGVIIYHGPRNMYYASEFDGSSNPPDCSSRDAITGFERVPDAAEGEEGYIKKECENCPFNEFGSGKDGRGKACKEKHQLYILVSGQVIPYSLMLPVSSIKEFNSFTSRLFNKGKFLSEVLTSFTLIQDKNATGIKYSKIAMKKVRDLTEDEVAACAKRAEQIRKDIENG